MRTRRCNQFLTMAGADRLYAGFRRHHRARHRHRFENLVLNPPCHAHRRHHHGSMLQPGPDVVHPAGHRHLRRRQRQDRSRRPCADDVEAQSRPSAAQSRQDVMHKPGHGVDIGPVVHGAGKDNRYAVCLHGHRPKGRGPRGIRRKIVRVDAVAQRMHRGRGFGRQAAKQLSLALGHKKRSPRPCRGQPLPVQQAGALTPVQPAQRPAAKTPVLGPLGGVDVDKIDHHRRRDALRWCKSVLRHRRRKHHDHVDSVALERARHPVFQASVLVVGQAQRLAAHQPLQAAKPGYCGPQFCQIQIGAHRPDRRLVHRVARVIDKAAEKHPVALGQMPEHVVRAQLVALVGRKWNPVHQIQNIRHGRAQPRLRTRIGPSQLARPAGMRRHASIRRR